MDLQRRIYAISEMLLCFMLNVLLITVVFLMCGVSVNCMNFFLPVVLMVLYRLRYFPEGKKYLWIDFAACVGIFMFFLLLAANTYDQTWDGAAYHKTAVGLLKEGWNPYYMSAEEFNTAAHIIDPPRNNPLLWAEAYPKATWYFASTVYNLTSNIEYGKSYTLIFAFITFGISMDFFKRKKLRNGWIVILSAVTSLNPIVCAQFQTYYLDGVVAEVLTLLIIKFLELLEGINKEEQMQKDIAIFALIAWGCNLKFNIALYIATICAIYCICISVRAKKLQIRSACILAAEGAGALFLTGCNPYITNIFRHGNMFYGFEGMLNEEEFQRTFGIVGLNNLGRFWTSVFGRTSHGQYSNLKEVLKMPFTFRAEEMNYYDIPDVRVGGFGIMFSALFLISCIVMTVVLIQKIRNKKGNISFIFVFLLCAVSIVEFCFVPQSSQLRYIPHLYLCVILALYCLAVCEKGKVVSAVAVMFAFVIGINLLPWMCSSYKRNVPGQQTTATLRYMGKMCENEGKKYEVSFYCDDFTGIVFNLKDFGIRYQYTEILNADKDTFNSTFANWLYYKEKQEHNVN